MRLIFDPDDHFETRLEEYERDVEDGRALHVGCVSGRPMPPASPPQDGAPAQATEVTDKNAPAPLVPAGG